MFHALLHVFCVYIEVVSASKNINFTWQTVEEPLKSFSVKACLSMNKHNKFMNYVNSFANALPMMWVKFSHLTVWWCLFHRWNHNNGSMWICIHLEFNPTSPSTSELHSDSEFSFALGESWRTERTLWTLSEQNCNCFPSTVSTIVAVILLIILIAFFHLRIPLENSFTLEWKWIRRMMS